MLQETDSALSNQSLLSPQGGRARSTTFCLMVIKFKALRLRDHYEWWTIPKPQIFCTSFTAFVRHAALTALEQVDIFRLIHSEKSDFTGCLVQGSKEKAWGLFFGFFFFTAHLREYKDKLEQHLQKEGKALLDTLLPKAQKQKLF